MSLKITLKNKSQETEELGKEKSNVLTFSRSIYQRLRSLAANKHILIDYQTDLLPKEFEDFCDKLNTDDPDIHKADEYLGSLGITEDYYYSKDRINIEPWLTHTAQDSQRNIVVREFKQKPYGNINNIIDRASGLNVVHNTTL